jgi:hypothetical protein
MDVRPLFPGPSAASAPASFASLIVAGFPTPFAEFRGKCLALLWRGSRDGFGAGDFHGRREGHAPTLTLIQGTDGNIFGGFTSVNWESRTKPPHFKVDPSLKNFVLALKNPHNFPARKFALKAEKKDNAIFCDPERGARFWDLGRSETCTPNTDISRWLGRSYVNDTSLYGNPILRTPKAPWNHGSLRSD